ncbi:hypothetical protein E3U43_008002 [Larimichthys crocea]|uniref:Uncharacterized protein n=1 Tax=Larimichthys crocea TaxID=215358 RepID=A0ACD3Q642_LARCR|nr:hypothetical protein E3U43_008002 [Larimichthys crocea]
MAVQQQPASVVIVTTSTQGPGRLLRSVVFPLHAVSDSAEVRLVLLHANAGLLRNNFLFTPVLHQKAIRHPWLVHGRLLHGVLVLRVCLVSDASGAEDQAVRR